MMDFSALLYMFMYGFMTAFFFGMIALFILKKRNASGENAKYIFAISACAMGFLFVECITSTSIYTYSTLYADDVLLLEYLAKCEDMFEMLVIPLFGCILLGLSSVKPTKMHVAIIAQSVILILLSIFAATRSNIVYYASQVLTLCYSLVIIYLTHKNVKRYQIMLCRIYSNTSRRGTRWVLNFLYLLVVQFSSWFLLEMVFRNGVNIVIYNLLSIVVWCYYAKRVNEQNFDRKAMIAMMEDYEASKSEIANKSDHIDDSIAAVLDEGMNEMVDKVLQSDKKLELTGETFKRLGDLIYKYCVTERHFTDPDLTVIDLARAIGTNRTYTAKWFSDRGENFNSYINNLRIEYAERLLRTTNENINNIYMKCGYSTAHNFRRVFKMKYGCTPSEYRDRLKEENSEN